MAEQKSCQDCQQKHDCMEAYKKLGDFKGPSVLPKIIVAFLLPIVVFLVSLAVFDGFIAQAITLRSVSIVSGLLFSSACSFVFVLAARFIVKYFNAGGGGQE